jgi:hypothetical protein
MEFQAWCGASILGSNSKGLLWCCIGSRELEYHAPWCRVIGKIGTHLGYPSSLFQIILRKEPMTRLRVQHNSSLGCPLTDSNTGEPRVAVEALVDLAFPRASSLELST